jgi:hypothetical protein
MATRTRFRKKTSTQLTFSSGTGGAQAPSSTLKPKPRGGTIAATQISTGPTAAVRRARAVKLGDLKPTQTLADGSKRRLSAEQAYLRRTTDSSRARVAKRYGLSAEQVARLDRKAGNAPRSLPKPVTAPAGGYPDKPSTPVALPRVTGSRTGTPQRGRRPRRRRRRGNGTGGAQAPTRY